MQTFLIYEGKVAVALLVFYLFYRFLLKKETFHRFNRAVLVGTAVLSFLLPLCVITIHKPLEVAPVASEPLAPALELPAPELLSYVEPAVPWWPVALTVLFWAGVAFVLARVALSILSLVRIVRRGTLVREEDGCRIIVTGRDIDPFSWMRYIVLSRQDWEAPHDSILAHEKAHIGLGHSTELLLVDILSSLQWFNPAIWMLRADLQELHEYEADDAVLRSGANIKAYQYLLIRKAVSKSGYSVANSFNHSILKNRITMMSKSKSPLVRGLRVLWLLPLVCLAIGLQARTVYVPVDKDSEKSHDQEQFEYFLPEIVVVKYADASVKPEDIIHANRAREIKMSAGKNFDTEPVCSENFSQWLNSRLSYPADCLYDGMLVAMFVVGEDGQVSDVSIVYGLCETLDKAVADVIGKSPAWTPAMKDGKPMATALFQPVVFQIRTAPMASSAQPAPVALHVHADGRVEGKDQVVPGTAVVIHADADTPMGPVNELKNWLREVGALKVYYARQSETESVMRHIAPSVSDKRLKVLTYDEALKGIDRHDICVVRINSQDKIFFENGAYDQDADILRIGKAFLRKHGAKTVFTLTYERGTSYGMYQHMQALLTQIYNEVREEKAQQEYGKSLDRLTEEERDAVLRLVPICILETDMKG